MTRKALSLLLASGVMLSCGDDGKSPTPATPTGNVALLSTSPAAGGTVALPAGFFDFFQNGDGWVQGLTVTVRFTYSEPIPAAAVFIVLWRASQQCLVAEGLVTGAPYGEPFNYVAGSTVTQSGNSFTGNSACRAGAERSFTTDRLQFLLMDTSRPPESRVVFAQEVPIGWRFE